MTVPKESILDFYAHAAKRCLRRIDSLEAKCEALAARSDDVKRYIAYEQAMRGARESRDHALTMLGMHYVHGTATTQARPNPR